MLKINVTDLDKVYAFKIAKLITKSAEINFDFDSAEIGINENSGNIYIWSEYESFCLYLPPNGTNLTVQYSDTCRYCGEEFGGDATSREEIEDGVKKQLKEHLKKNENKKCREEYE